MKSERKGQDPNKHGLATNAKITLTPAEMRAMRAKAAANSRKLQPANETKEAGVFASIKGFFKTKQTPEQKAKERDAKSAATYKAALADVQARTALKLP